MKKYFIFLVVFLLFNSSLFAQTNSSTKTYILKGTLKNQTSEIIAGANLYFEKDGQTNVVPTNINGEFKTELTKGDYKITVSAELSPNFLAFLKILENGLNPSNIDFTIKTNSENNYPKPLKLISPDDPPAARAVGATGEIIVSVKIDQTGKVISANVESGHPLLRKTSEKAAMNSIFESAQTEQDREAILTYVFIRPWKIKKDLTLKHFTTAHRVEIIREIEPVETTNSY